MASSRDAELKRIKKLLKKANHKQLSKILLKQSLYSAGFREVIFRNLLTPKEYGWYLLKQAKTDYKYALSVYKDYWFNELLIRNLNPEEEKEFLDYANQYALDRIWSVYKTTLKKLVKNKTYKPVPKLLKETFEALKSMEPLSDPEYFQNCGKVLRKALKYQNRYPSGVIKSIKKLRREYLES